jgi:methionyl-tRNA synthetase
VPYPSTAAQNPADDAIAETARGTIREFRQRCSINSSFRARSKQAWGLVAAVDKYIVENEPWALGEKQDDESRRGWRPCSTPARRLAHCDRAGASRDARGDGENLGADGAGRHPESFLADLEVGTAAARHEAGRDAAVFPRADKSAIERMQKMERAKTGAGSGIEASTKRSLAVRRRADFAAGVPAPPALLSDGKITIDDFAKVELRVGVVKVAERVPKADKLLRLEDRYRHRSAAGAGGHRRSLRAGRR